MGSYHSQTLTRFPSTLALFSMVEENVEDELLRLEEEVLGCSFLVLQLPARASCGLLWGKRDVEHELLYVNLQLGVCSHPLLVKLCQRTTDGPVSAEASLHSSIRSVVVVGATVYFKRIIKKHRAIQYKKD